MPRVAAQTAMRAASVQLLHDYNASLDPVGQLQIYAARPRSIKPPTAFVDALRENITYTGRVIRTLTVDVILIHGMFDTLSAANQRDVFVDGFLEWTFDHFHVASPEMIHGVVDVEDLPDYVPEWIPAESGETRTYYATRFSLEGLAGA